MTIYSGPAPILLDSWQRAVVGRIRARTAPDGYPTNRAVSIRQIVQFDNLLEYQQRRQINTFVRDLVRYQVLERRTNPGGHNAFYYSFTNKGLHWCDRVVTVKNRFTFMEVMDYMHDLLGVVNDARLRQAIDHMKP
ncbi:hypothetical protein [Achromobacter phage Motura]|uniref:Uncharacterized protein n=1 Tax=Achromobacter phage Motura TaxID=2591403 RepID=A0A514CSF0_9CAUD|nr:hypothetical protein H1O15_gp069 [Achromobacter phage Motura]QDH83393.1 hypothetical protein [Achromobacter phage Motura]